jgi:asparagine N-glycosylation enzyme membrane subunit Stt3
MMSELDLLEPENLINVVTLLITLAVFLVTALAYYRTRLRGVLIVSLLAALLATNIILEVGDEFLEEGVPNFELLTSLFALGISVLLLMTVLRRFEWQKQ